MATTYEAKFVLSTVGQVVCSFQYKDSKGNFVSSNRAVYVNDVLKNVDTGEVYVVTKSGGVTTKHPSIITQSDINGAAKVQYVRTDIVHLPGKIAGLTIERNGTVFTAKWTKPTVNEKSPSRPTSIGIRWSINDEVAWTEYIDVNSTSHSYSIYRTQWYPYKDKPKLSYVSVRVWLHNPVGDGQWVSTPYFMSLPVVPGITALSFNSTTNKVECTVTATNDDKGKSERYSTTITKRITKASTSIDPYTTTDTSYRVEMDASGYSSIADDVSWEFRVDATSKGLAGDGVPAIKSFRIARPKEPTISSFSVSGRSANDRIFANINTQHSDRFPVQQVILQYAIGEWWRSSDIPSDAWQDGTADVGTSNSMSMPVSTLGAIERGQYVWLRLLSWYLVRENLQKVSKPVLLSSLYQAPITAANDAVIIHSIEQVGANSLKCELLWEWDNSTHTEISWSTSENAWQSTEAPSTFLFDWYEAGTWAEGDKTYNRRAFVYVDGLEEGVTYNLRARRVRKTDSGDSYGPYSATSTATAGEAADSVVVMADPIVARGSGLSVTWEFQSAKTQEAYDIRTTGGLQLASGEGPRRTVEIPAARIAEVGDTFQYSVLVLSGGKWTQSDTLSAVVVNPPTLALTTPATLTAQPLAFSVECNENCSLRIVLTANGITGNAGIGLGDQTEGDVIHSAIVNPIWSNGGATVTLPDGLDLRDGGVYTLEVIATDTYGLQSAPISASVPVDWAHKAGMPNCEVTPDNTTASVVLALAAPEDAATGDVYDVYRMNGERPQLVASGIAQDATITDTLAPYGTTHAYRVATRTVDGDMQWTDFAYTLDGAFLRFDWQGGALELPYNLAIDDGYTKGVEVRTHLDGTQDAYWDGSVNRKASLSSTVITLQRPEDIESARALGRHTGPVFVRTPDGQAYPADVQLRSVSANNDRIAAVSFDATEVDMTDAFMVVME